MKDCMQVLELKLAKTRKIKRKLFRKENIICVFLNARKRGWVRRERERERGEAIEANRWSKRGRERERERNMKYE